MTSEGWSTHACDCTAMEDIQSVLPLERKKRESEIEIAMLRNKYGAQKKQRISKSNIRNGKNQQRSFSFYGQGKENNRVQNTVCSFLTSSSKCTLPGCAAVTRSYLANVSQRNPKEQRFSRGGIEYTLSNNLLRS